MGICNASRIMDNPSISSDEELPSRHSDLAEKSEWVESKDDAMSLEVKSILEKAIVDIDDGATQIRLTGCRIGPRGAEILNDALKNTQALTFLQLGDTNLGDEGAKRIANALKYNSSLQILHLGRNNIGDVGAASIADFLKSNPTITWINFFYNNIGDEGAKRIADALLTNYSLQTLSFPSNYIGDEGAKHFGDVLETNSTIRWLDMKENKIGVPGILALANIIKVRGNLVVYLGSQDADHTYKNTLVDGFVSDATLIGEGQYGAAYAGNYEGRKCVAKVAHDKESAESVYETLLLQCLPEHQNILELIGVKHDFIVEGQEHTALIVQYHKKGSLKSFVQKQEGYLDLPMLLALADGMTRGIEHLHNYDILHRDVALRNFVLSDGNQPILIDFGLSCSILENQVVHVRKDERLPWRSMAPESLMELIFKKNSDVWMLGLAFWELLKITKHPFSTANNASQLRTKFKNMEANGGPVPLIFRKSTPRKFRKLIESCCVYNAEERPTASDLILQIGSMIENIGTDDEKDDICFNTSEELHEIDETYTSPYGGYYSDPFKSLDDTYTPFDNAPGSYKSSGGTYTPANNAAGS